MIPQYFSYSGVHITAISRWRSILLKSITKLLDFGQTTVMSKLRNIDTRMYLPDKVAKSCTLARPANLAFQDHWRSLNRLRPQSGYMPRPDRFGHRNNFSGTAPECCWWSGSLQSAQLEH